MREEVKESSLRREEMDAIDRAQQNAIEAMSARIEAMTWVILAFMVVFGSSIIMIIAGMSK